jgi:hypothetical protein
MVSRSDDSNLLALALVLSRLANTSERRYAMLLDRFLERRLPQMLDIHTGEKELDILLEDLIRSGDFEDLILREDPRGRKDLYSRRALRDEAQEVAEFTIQRFRREFNSPDSFAYILKEKLSTV